MYITSGDHDPAHLHASDSGGAWHVKVHFLHDDEDAMFVSLKPADARIPGKIRRGIVQGVRNHRAALIKEWDACHEGMQQNHDDS